MPALSDVVNRVSVTGAGNRSGLGGDGSMVRRSRSAEAWPDRLRGCGNISAHAFARSTRRSAAVPRASGPSSAHPPNASRRSPVRCRSCLRLRTSRSRGSIAARRDQLIGMAVAGEPQLDHSAVCGVPQLGHGGLGFAVPSGPACRGGRSRGSPPPSHGTPPSSVLPARRQLGRGERDAADATLPDRQIHPVAVVTGRCRDASNCTTHNPPAGCCGPTTKGEEARWQRR